MAIGFRAEVELQRFAAQFRGQSHYLADQTFLESAQLTQQFGSCMVKAYAMLLDKLTKGEGFVEQEICSDLSLQSAIQREMVDYVRLVTNRMQIFIFSISDCFHAKKKQANGNPHQHEEPVVEQCNRFECERNGEPFVEESGPSTWPDSPDPVVVTSRGEGEEREEENF